MLSDYLEQLETTKADFLKKISNLDQDQLSWSPSEDKWSIDQVIHHLVLAEQATLIYMNKKIQAADSMKVEKFKSRRNLLTLQIFFGFPLKWKVPETFIQPKSTFSNEELKKEWAAVREELKQFIEKNAGETLDMNIFRHPLAGRMNMQNTLQFMKLHIKHHSKQVDRIARAGNFSDVLN
ncbi:MAG: DinB family protein [Bacteroidia bacterium]|nr:DinB family protein [Bacteroidia bacterium]